MKAVVIDEFGGPEVLRYRDVPDPSLSPASVLVEVRAVGVNRGDLQQLCGHIESWPDVAHILDDSSFGQSV